MNVNLILFFIQMLTIIRVIRDIQCWKNTICSLVTSLTELARAKKLLIFLFTSNMLICLKYSTYHSTEVYLSFNRSLQLGLENLYWECMNECMYGVYMKLLSIEPLLGRKPDFGTKAQTSRFTNL